MSSLAHALLAELDEGDLDLLAEKLAPRLQHRLALTEVPADAWLTTRQAADYLGVSLDALHKLTAARTVPFEQERPGCKCWFKRSDLDAWRAGR